MSAKRASWLRPHLPFLDWPAPSRVDWKRETLAGITVALLLVPQAIAYATLAGMPAVAGLQACLLPSLIALLLCRSQRLAVGPTALTSVLIGATLAPMAIPTSAEWVNLAVWLALLSGAMQLLMGSLRAGWLMNLISSPVMMAFTQASAALIVWSQLPALMGLRELRLDELATLPGQLSPPVLAMGLGCLVAMWALRRWVPRLPGILVVVVAAGVLGAITGYASHGRTVGPVQLSWAMLHWPMWPGWTTLGSLMVPAAVIALVSLLETASSARVDNERRGTRWDQDQDLIGQGMGKIAAGLVGTFATSTSFSRSALNLSAGAQTAWANLVCIVAVGLVLLIFTPWLQHIPMATLAAIVIFTVINLFKPRQWQALWQLSRIEALTAAVTFAVTLLSAPRIYWGVVAGTVMCLSQLLYWRLHPRIIELGLHPDGSLRDRHLWRLPVLAEGVLALRMDAALDFSTASAFDQRVMNDLAQQPQVRHLFLFAQPINRMDASGAETFAKLLGELRTRGIALHLVGTKLPVQRMLEAAQLLNEPTLSLHRTDQEALHAMAQLASGHPPSCWGDHI